MFLLGKIVALFTQPLNWVIALLALSLLVHASRQRLRRRLQWSALLLALVMGWQPLPDMVYRQLAQGYVEFAPEADLSGFHGVVVLGGALDKGYVAKDHAQPELNAAAERMTAALALAQRHAHLQVVFTGGEGDYWGAGPSEAQRAAQFFTAMGLASSRVVYEGRSRTTYENAVFTAALAGVDKGQRWLLLTSAWHMPRAMASFAAAGWNATAYPVDFRTGNATPWTAYSPALGAERWQKVLHEVVGLVAYRLTGRL